MSGSWTCKWKRCTRHSCLSLSLSHTHTHTHTLASYADWCGYCKKFAPKYEAAERILASNAQTSHVRVGKVNVDTAPSLAARFFVSRLPTVVHIKEHEVRVIPPAQTSNLASLIANEEWRAIEPVKGLTSPFSIL